MTESLFARTAPYGCADGATFSADRKYRYRLWRWLGGSPEHRCVFVGVNPSSADETENDHTITKEMGFGKRWGFGAIDKVNLFPFVSTDVTGLLRCEDPTGGAPGDEALREAFANAHRIVLCWGKHNARVRKLVAERLAAAPWILGPHPCEVGTFGHNPDGSPRHPLMLAYDTRFQVNRTTTRP